MNSSDTVQVRHTSSDKSLTSVSTTLTIGSLSGSFTSKTIKADTTPDVFSFADQTNLMLSTWVESSSIIVNGINAPTAIAVTKGEYRINGGAYTDAVGIVRNGDTVQVRHMSSSKALDSVSTTLDIGGVTGSFTSKTAKADTSPDSISFSSQASVTLSTVIESNVAKISGINAPTPISVANGEYRINDGVYTSVSVTVNNGDAVQVRHTSSAKSKGSVITTLKVGTVFATFKTTAIAIDTVPDVFNLIAQTDVPKSTMMESNMVTVSGINAPTQVSVTGGEYRVNGGVYSAIVGTVNNGDTVQVRHTSPPRSKGSVFTTLKIGTVFASFKTTAK